MSQRTWRCRNAACGDPHGAVLGRVTAGGGLVLSSEVVAFAVYLDSRRVAVRCPRCGAAREFRGNAVFSTGRGPGAP